MTMYIDMAYMATEVARIYAGVIENFSDERNKDFLADNFDADTLKTSGEWYAERVNKEMRGYLHQASRSVCNSMANVDYDYAKHIGESRINGKKAVDCMVRCCESEISGKNTADFRRWLVDWYLDTVGRYWIAYKFGECVCDQLYEWERDEERLRETA